MANYWTYINESLTTEGNGLFKQIYSLDYWICNDKKYGGLGLKSDINELLEYHTKPLTEEEIHDFINGLNVLKNAKMIDNETYRKKSYWITFQRMVKENGNWCILNKLNTNISALSFIIAFLIDKMKDDNDNPSIKKYGLTIEKMIQENPREGLMKLEKKFKDIINYYFPNLDKDLNQLIDFIRPIIGDTTEIGEKYEDRTEEFLKEQGFEIKFKGGNGNFIDMIFGTDLIIYHEKYGYKRVQVKPLNYNSDRKRYIQLGVEWLAKTNGIDVNIVDMESLTPILQS